MLITTRGGDGKSESFSAKSISYFQETSSEMYYFTLLCHRLRHYRLACSKRFKQNSLFISRTNIVGLMLFFSSVCVMIHLMFSFFHIGYCWHKRHTLESLTFSVCNISDFLLFTFCSPCQGSLKCHPVCFQLNFRTARWQLDLFRDRFCDQVQLIQKDQIRWHNIMYQHFSWFYGYLCLL